MPEGLATGGALSLQANLAAGRRPDGPDASRVQPGPAAGVAQESDEAADTQAAHQRRERSSEAKSSSKLQGKQSGSAARLGIIGLPLSNYT